MMIVAITHTTSRHTTSTTGATIAGTITVSLALAVMLTVSVAIIVVMVLVASVVVILCDILLAGDKEVR